MLIIGISVLKPLKKIPVSLLLRRALVIIYNHSTVTESKTQPKMRRLIRGEPPAASPDPPKAETHVPLGVLVEYDMVPRTCSSTAPSCARSKTAPSCACSKTAPSCGRSSQAPSCIILKRAYFWDTFILASGPLFCECCECSRERRRRARLMSVLHTEMSAVQCRDREARSIKLLQRKIIEA